MARSRDPKRDEAFALYKNSHGAIKLKDIATQLEISEGTVRGWKSKDKWDDQLKGTLLKKKRNAPKNMERSNKKTGAPRGNKNAVGNSGGPPPKNKNALKTGEYETIWLDTLDEEERVLFDVIETDELLLIEENIRLLTIRERRMLKHIDSLKNELSDKERRVLQERRNIKEPLQVEDTDGTKKTVMRNQPQMVITQIEETESRKIEDIMSVEDALTRIQDKKLKAIKMKYEISVVHKHKQWIDEQKLELERQKYEEAKDRDDQEDTSLWVANLAEVAKRRRKLKGVPNE